jgi:hypothetical protein
MLGHFWLPGAVFQQQQYPRAHSLWRGQNAHLGVLGHANTISKFSNDESNITLRIGHVLLLGKKIQ